MEYALMHNPMKKLQLALGIESPMGIDIYTSGDFTRFALTVEYCGGKFVVTINDKLYELRSSAKNIVSDVFCHTNRVEYDSVNDAAQCVMSLEFLIYVISIVSKNRCSDK